MEKKPVKPAPPSPPARPADVTETGTPDFPQGAPGAAPPPAANLPAEAGDLTATQAFEEKSEEGTEAVLAASKEAGAALATTEVHQSHSSEEDPALAHTEVEHSGKTPAGPAPARMKLTTLGEFRLEKKLGEGGMGVVYKARQVSLDRDVAVKVMAKHLASDPTVVQRFQREAKVMAKLDHPHILRCFTVNEDHGFHYLAMEYVEGGSLEGWIKKLGKFRVGDALHIILAAADALQHAHEQGLIHRDIKPDNILLTGKGVVKVADLGLAKAISDETLTLTRTGTGAGTPVYMSPEQARDAKHVDGRSDIYALGCMLYRCLTGKPPFEGETFIELFEAKEKGKFPPARRSNVEVPEKLDLIIDKMVAKDPKYRYQTCAELIRDLEALGLANPTLSFFAAATGGSPAGKLAARKAETRPAAAPAARPAPAKSEPEPEWWYLRQKSGGKIVIRKLSRDQLLELVQDKDFDLKSEVSRSRDEGFGAVASYREFEHALRARLAKVQAERKVTKYKSKYDQILKEERAYQRKRKVHNLFLAFGGWVSLVLWLGGIAVVGYIGYLVIQALFGGAE